MVYMLAGCLSEKNVRALFFEGLHLINAGCCTEIATAAGGKQLHIQVGTDSKRAHLVSLEHGCIPKCVACKHGCVCEYTIASGLHWDDMKGAIDGWPSTFKLNYNELFADGIDEDAGKKKCGPKQRQCSMVRAQGEFKHKLAAVAPEMEQLSPSKGVGTVFVVNRVPLAPTKFPHNKRQCEECKETLETDAPAVSAAYTRLLWPKAGCLSHLRSMLAAKSFACLVESSSMPRVVAWGGLTQPCLTRPWQS